MEINKEEQHVSEDVKEELGRRLKQAEDVCRELRERHAHLYEHGLIIEEVINEMEAEKKSLTCKLKWSQQEVDNIRKKWREDEIKEEEGAKKRLSVEERIRIYFISIKMIENNFQKIRKKNEALKTKLHKLSQQATHGKEIYNLKTTEQEFKQKLNDMHEVLCRRDEEINKLNTTLAEKNNELEEYYNNIKDLRKDQRELQEQISSRQEEQTIALTSETTRKQPGAGTKDEGHDGENDLKTKRWWDVAKWLCRGVIVTGAISQCVHFNVGIMDSMMPVCNCADPDCNLWTMVYDLLDTYIQQTHTAIF